MKHIWLLILFLSIFLIGCQPTPKQLAEAEVIRAKAAAQEIQNQQQKELGELKIAAEQARLEAYKQSVQTFNQSLQQRLPMLVDALLYTTTVVLVILSACLAYVAIGMSRAATRSAAQRAGAIWIDPQTSTFPILVLDGYIHNPNTGEVLRLGVAQQPDPQRVKQDAYLRTTSLLAQSTAKIAAQTGGQDAWQASANLPHLAQSTPLLDYQEVEKS